MKNRQLGHSAIVLAVFLGCLLILMAPRSFGEEADKSGDSSWTKAVRPNLDLKLSYNYESSEDEKDRHRLKFRWRAGADVSLHDSVTMGFGLASSGANARSTSETFKETFSSKSIAIDYAYARYSYEGILTVQGGKFKNPLWRPSQLLWDSDITPEGLSLGVELDLHFLDVFFVCGLFILDEAKEEPDPLMFPLQVGFDWTLAKRFSIKIAGAYYIFNEVEGRELFKPTSAPDTNTLEGGGLKYDFDSFGCSAELGLRKLLPAFLPYIGLAGDFVINLDPPDDNIGFIVKGRLGYRRVSGFGTWQASYSYRRLERDCWPDAFPDSSFRNGATNAEGHCITLSVGLLENVTLGVLYYLTDDIENGGNQEHLLQSSLHFKL